MTSSGFDMARKTRPVRIAVGARSLPGDLAVPAHVRGLVIFAHGSGSSRASTRNKFIADVLDQRAFATLLVDFFTEEELTTDERTGRLRFDMTLQAERLIAFWGWAQRVPELRGLPAGLFGAGGGAGAALFAASQQPRSFRAIVGRGGRPDLAGSALRRVMAPTLLIVGELDDQVLDVNRRAMERMLSEVRLEVVPGASHLFEEPGTLAQVADLTSAWFTERLTPHERS
jgi:putative phosphoribosyl transferase